MQTFKFNKIKPLQILLAEIVVSNKKGFRKNINILIWREKKDFQTLHWKIINLPFLHADTNLKV